LRQQMDGADEIHDAAPARRLPRKRLCLRGLGHRERREQQQHHGAGPELGCRPRENGGRAVGTSRGRSAEAFALQRAECLALKPRGFERPSPRHSHEWASLIIFPGFIRLSGSSARLIVRMTSSAGPCSAWRYFILPVPTPCSPLHVPPIASARSTIRSFSRPASSISAVLDGSSTYIR